MYKELLETSILNMNYLNRLQYKSIVYVFTCDVIKIDEIRTRIRAIIYSTTDGRHKKKLFVEDTEFLEPHVVGEEDIEQTCKTLLQKIILKGIINVTSCAYIE